LKRLVATLCVALTMFYAATMPAKAGNQIQHTLPIATAHQHSAIDVVASDATTDDGADHADHHRDSPDDQDRSDKDSANGHHHHGDGGSSALLPEAMAAATMVPTGSLRNIGRETAITGLRSIEPERPPRNTSLNT